MTSESTAQDELNSAISAAAEAVHLRELGDGALAALKRSVDASAALLYRYDEHGVFEPLAGDLAALMSHYGVEIIATDPLQQAPRRMAAGAKVVFATHTVKPGEFRASAAYNEFYRPHDIEHVVCTWLTATTLYGAPGMAGIFLARSAKQPDFAEREVHALERALPAFAAAARRSARVDAEGREHHVLDALLASAPSRPLLALDTRGRLIWISGAAERLLAPILGHRRALPAALVDAAQSLGAVTTPRRADVVAPSRFAISIPLLDGTCLRAELALARTRGGEPIVAVELEPRAGRPDLADFVARHRLTRAETDVLRALARGLANREIAAELFVSIETVRTHVGRVLAKLGVPTRARAAVLVRDLVG